MAATRAALRARIQELLGDTNPAERVVVQFRYDEVIQRNYGLMSGHVSVPRATVVGVSFVAGDFEETLTATVKGLSVVLLHRTGAELVPVPWEQFNAYYRQDTSAPRDRGTPHEYSIRENNTTSDLLIRIGPTPDQDEIIRFYASYILTAPTTESFSIPFSDELINGLASACAAEIVMMLSATSLERLGLDKTAASVWKEQADTAVRDFNLRQQQLGARQDRILRAGGRRTQSGYVVTGGG